MGVSTFLTAIWHQGKALVNHLLGHPSPTSTTQESTRRISTHRLSHALVEIVVAHLAHDIGALKACSLTCRSWYIAAVPLIHHALVLNLAGSWIVYRSLLEPISKLYELDLIHLVKSIQVAQEPGLGWRLLPQSFTDRDLQHFSALANVHTLKIQCLEIYRFIPDIEHHFGHFSQTLRSLTLWQPYCTPQQLSHFLSLFSNLDDVGIRNAQTYASNPIGPDVELVRFSTPKLRGRLALYGSPSVEIWTDIVTSCGGIRFRHMDLRMSTGCAPILFNGCADTLETLRFGGMKDESVDLDLSPLKVLRSLQFDVWGHHFTAAPGLFSTITSTAFSELVLTLGRRHLPLPITLFTALRSAYEIRHFNLVFLFLAEGPDVGEGRRELAEALDSATTKGLLDFIDPKPTIRIARPRQYKWDLLDFD